jgi:DNA polymerase III epsilon subunit family exonuclease
VTITEKGAGRGRSLLQPAMDFVALDVETTGLSPYTDKMIEIGLVRVRNGVERECYSTLIQPERRLSSRITALTGITDEMLSNAPVIRDILPDVLDFIGGDIIVGHNVSFDIGFMQAACMHTLETGFVSDYIDTMRLSRKYFRDLPDHRLATLVCAFGIDQGNAHRALADAQATTRCYLYMWEQIEKSKSDDARAKNSMGI